MKNIISIIVPVYNVERYLPQCIESLLAQTYTALEIILIDDGATDGSGEICEKYASMDSRIRVIHQENGGAASARNAGLRVATGEYIAFVDGDDFLEVDAYEFMESVLSKSKSDFVQCCVRNIYTDHFKDIVQNREACCYTIEKYLERFTFDWTCGLATDKLFCRQLFENIFYVEGHKIDDEFFTYKGILNAKKVLYYPKVVYNYRQRGSSVMLSESSGKKIVLDKLEYLKTRRKTILERFPQLAVMFDNHYANMLIVLATESYATKESITQTQRQIKDFLLEKPSPQIAFRMKIQLRCVQYKRINKLLSQRKKREDNLEVEKYFA